MDDICTEEGCTVRSGGFGVCSVHAAAARVGVCAVECCTIYVGAGKRGEDALCTTHMMNARSRARRYRTELGLDAIRFDREDMMPLEDGNTRGRR